MKNEKLWRRFQRVLETPSATFRYFQTSCFTITLHYPFLSTAIPPFPPSPPLFTIPRPPHHPNSKSTANGGHHNYSFFIFHHSSFIIFAANPAIPTITAAPHSLSPRTIKNRNSRHRRNHNSSFFIIHFSSFILTHRRQPHHRRQPRTTHRPALPPFFIFHLSKHHPLPSLRPSYQLFSLTF